VNGFQGKENMVQVIDCGTLGGGVDGVMGFLGADRRRFNVAMSSGKVSCIVVRSEDYIKGKCTGWDSEANSWQILRLLCWVKTIL
jgi:hypothetical protein